MTDRESPAPMLDLPRYDRTQSYDWNYEQRPAPQQPGVTKVPGDWRFLGHSLTAPIGIAAGPLLHGDWCRYYASLGFEVVTYKTVRSRSRACYPLPNLLPVACEQLSGSETELPADAAMRGTWAVAFGMPSKEVAVWRADLEATRQAMPSSSLLVVSVVGTVDESARLDDLASDYAECARLAVASGANAIEANFSCPNVATCDGQLYQHPLDAQLVAARIRDAIGSLPLVIKIGHLTDEGLAAELLDVLSPYADAVSTTNSVATRVRAADGSFAFEGQKRGICGDGIRAASLRQVELLRKLIEKRGLRFEVVGVGGASCGQHVREYLAAGANHVQLATAAMVDPEIGLKIRSELAR